MEQRIIRIQYAPFKMEIAYKTMLNILRGLEPNFENVHRGLLKDLVNYIQASSEENRLKLDTAIAFLGPTGTGKTLLFRAISEYMKIDDVKFNRNGKIARFGFEIVSARAVVSKFASDGFDAIQPIIVKPAICIDDVGSENLAQHYGNKIEVFEHIIEERYYNNRITHFSSNLNEQLIRERYGERVYSRIVETTNFIKIEGKDFRLQKK